MKNNILFLLLSIFTSFATLAQSITDYDQISLGKDAYGNDVKFYFIPVPRTSTCDIFYYDTFGRFIVKIDDMASMYDSKTLEHIRTFKQKGEKIRNLFEDGYIPYTEGEEKLSFYNFDGKKIWSTKNTLVLDLDSIILCTNRYNRDKLIAYDRSTGNEFWTLNVSAKDQPLAKITSFEDKPEYVYAVADSLYRVEVATGKNIRRHIQTSRRTGKFFGKDYIGLHSNFWLEGDSLFIADADSLYCLDLDFRSIWQTALPKDEVAKSGIWSSGDSIKLFSVGWTYLPNYVPVSFAGPFAASFDIKTGRILTSNDIGMKKTANMMSYCDDGRIYIVKGDKIFYTDEGDSTLTKIDFEPNYNLIEKIDKTSRPEIKIEREIYMIKAGVMMPIQSGKSHVIINLRNKDFYLVSPDGHSEPLPVNEVYFYDINNFYYTKPDEKGMRAFAEVDPDTDRVTFYGKYVNGKAFRDENGSMIVRTKAGIGMRMGQKPKTEQMK